PPYLLVRHRQHHGESGPSGRLLPRPPLLPIGFRFPGPDLSGVSIRCHAHSAFVDFNKYWCAISLYVALRRSLSAVRVAPSLSDFLPSDHLRQAALTSMARISAQ